MKIEFNAHVDYTITEPGEHTTGPGDTFIVVKNAVITIKSNLDTIVKVVEALKHSTHIEVVDTDA